MIPDPAEAVRRRIRARWERRRAKTDERVCLTLNDAGRVTTLEYLEA